MDKKLTKIFSLVKHQPETNLAEDIWKDIIIKERRNTRLRLWVFSIIGSISLVGFVSVAKIMIADFAQSGFYEYFSLIFSKNAISLWKEIALSLAQSLPVVSITFSLTIIFIFFLSLKYVLKEINKSQLSFSLSF